MCSSLYPTIWSTWYEACRLFDIERLGADDASRFKSPRKNEGVSLRWRLSCPRSVPLSTPAFSNLAHHAAYQTIDGTRDKRFKQHCSTHATPSWLDLLSMTTSTVQHYTHRNRDEDSSSNYYSTRRRVTEKRKWQITEGNKTWLASQPPDPTVQRIHMKTSNCRPALQSRLCGLIYHTNPNLTF